MITSLILCTLYLGTTVRFQLFFTYEKDNPIGRVVCLHKYLIFEKVHFNFLGEFTFDSLGQTNLPPEANGELRTLVRNADEIIITFLDKAIEFGPTEFAVQ
jgi:hypothetical protein